MPRGTFKSVPLSPQSQLQRLIVFILLSPNGWKLRKRDSLFSNSRALWFKDIWNLSCGLWFFNCQNASGVLTIIAGVEWVEGRIVGFQVRDQKYYDQGTNQVGFRGHEKNFWIIWYGGRQLESFEQEVKSFVLHLKELTVVCHLCAVVGNLGLESTA